MLHTSESLVARCDGEGALLHSQLVKLGELWRDSSRGRLRVRGDSKRNGGNGKHRKRKNKNHSQYRQSHNDSPQKKNFHTHISQSYTCITDIRQCVLHDFSI